MLSWLPRRRPRIAGIEAEAEMLVRDLDEAAFSAAQRRQQEASSDEIARDWGLVALAVARLISERKDVDPLGNECRSRSRPRSGRLAQASILTGADAGRGIGARDRRHDQPLPNPICRRGAGWRTDNFDGSRHSGGGCVGSHRRRRDISLGRLER